MEFTYVKTFKEYVLNTWNFYMKIWLKTQHSKKKKNKKTKIMADGPITSWQIDEETMETVTDFVFLGSKITADGDCSHEIKRHLLLWEKKKL